MRLNGYGYTRAAIADQLAIKVSYLDSIAHREESGEDLIEALQALLDRGRPAPGDIPKPQGIKISGAEYIPAQPTEAPPAAKPATSPAGAKPLTRDEADSAGDWFPIMLRETFDQFDSSLMQMAPIYIAEGQKLNPAIWSAITTEECNRLAGILIGMGRHNFVVAQAVRYAQKYNDARFVIELMVPRVGATGMYIAGSVQQSQQRQRAAQKGRA